MTRNRIEIALVALVALFTGMVLLATPTTLEAQSGNAPGASAEFGPGNFGLGLGMGTLATGLTGKLYVTSGTAFQAHVGYTNGWGWGNCNSGRSGYDCRTSYGFGVNLDYIGTFADIVRGAAGRLFASVGGGGAFSSSGPFGSGFVAANGVLELGWHFSGIPIELVADWRPFIGFGNGSMFHSLFDFGFSGRFYF